LCMITVASSVRISFASRSKSAEYITSDYSTTNPPRIVRSRNVSWNCLLHFEVRMALISIELHSTMTQTSAGTNALRWVPGWPYFFPLWPLLEHSVRVQYCMD
jgi:hypothetical protein